jgi:hypothetical protein
MQVRLGEAEELKRDGNDLFRRSNWNDALQRYRDGLGRLPKRREPPLPSPSSPPPTPPTTTDKQAGDPPPARGEAAATGTSTEDNSQSEPTAPAKVDSPLERECAKMRSVLHANIAACHVKLASAHARSLSKTQRKLMRSL